MIMHMNDPTLAVYLSGRLVVRTGDITEFSGDAIVNAANSSLMGGGGVDGAIHRAGGPAILQACRRIRETDFPGGLPAGKAVITPAGNLRCRFVIHTVGPVWYGGTSGEKETLAAAYKSCLALAKEHSIKTIAFPAISTGVYGFPKELAGPIVYESVRNHLAHETLPETVFLVFFSQQDARTFIASIGEH